MALMISTITVAKSDGLKESDSIFQIGHLLDRNVVK